MAGGYCKFCDHRCFVERRLPHNAKWRPGEVIHMATCKEGVRHDLEMTGYTFRTAHKNNKTTEGIMKKYTPEEIKAHREEWVAALRSGKYKQTRGKLKSRNGAYCCLGVACTLVPDLVVAYRGGTYYFGGEAGYEDATLPDEVAEWLGVDTTHSDVFLESPVTQGDETTQSLIHMNDNFEWSFEQIADAIEEMGLQ